MILPAFHYTSTRKVVLELPHLLSQEIESYRVYYKETYGAEVAEADLVREIVRYTLGQDEGFRGFKSGCPQPKVVKTRASKPKTPEPASPPVEAASASGSH